MVTRCARLALVLVTPVLLALPGATPDFHHGLLAAQASRANHTTTIPYADARPILERLRSSLPPEPAAKTTAELESAWPEWVSRRDADIRARVERGDEDSIINLLLFG